MTEQNGVRRVDLSDGQWWDLNTRPRWGIIRQLQASAEDTTGMLAALSVGWSFDGDITVETIDDRDMEHVIEVLGVLTREVLPLFEALTARLSTE